MFKVSFTANQFSKPELSRSEFDTFCKAKKHADSVKNKFKLYGYYILKEVK